MRYITLSQNKKALVDDGDYLKLNEIKWYFEHGYARSDVGRKRLYMHRFIFPESKIIDHVNGNGLDNRRANLRTCTQSLNMGNKKKPSNNTSGYKGVHWNKTLKYWMTSIKRGDKIVVKYSKTKEEAAKKYNELAVEYFGEFALLNKVQ